MKKLFALLTALIVVIGLAACSKTTTTEKKTTAKTTEATTTAEVTTTAAPTVKTWAEYMAAEDGTNVELEVYVQAKNSWYNTLTLYASDEDGNGVFIYEMTCTQEQDAALEIGTKIKVSGQKASWDGEVEIAKATFEVVAGAEKKFNDAVSVSVAAENLQNYMNRLVSFTEIFTVVSYKYEVTDETTGEKSMFDTEKASVYGSKDDKSKGADVYFMVQAGDEVYTFLVRSYLTNSDTDVYKAAEALQVGDKIMCQGYAYWWNGINPHITSITHIVE